MNHITTTLRAASAPATPIAPPFLDYDRVLPLKEVMHATGVSRSSIYAWIAAKRFPAPIKIGLRRTGWRASAIREWLASREMLN